MAALQTLYSCGIYLVQCGNCIAVSLDRALADCDLRARNKSVHSTVFYRKEGFSPQHLQQLLAFRAQWLAERGRLAKGGTCTFEMKKWGPRSHHVLGELHDFIMQARQHFAEDFDLPEQRPPHVELAH